ncbi:MAG: hypothetical protein II776_07810 [Clostridia bacterium]|nr:hypothetical protein [Clostridia bacterium]
MNKVRKKFLLYAMIALAVLLIILLGVINGTNFTMVAEDADQVTQMIADGQGGFSRSGGNGETPTPPDMGGENGQPTPPDMNGENGRPTPPDMNGENGEMPTPPDFGGENGQPGFGGSGRGERPGSGRGSGENGAPAVSQSAENETAEDPAPAEGEAPAGKNGGRPFGERSGDQQGRPFRGGFGNMGTVSPELPFSARYFVIRFNAEGNGEIVTFNVAALTEDEAMAMAQKLVKEDVGWVESVYRYRVYRENGYTYVVAVDQSRELLPSYRTLIISAIGLLAGLLICFGFLSAVLRRLFRPLEDADRKEKTFISEAEKEFKVPLTVIHTDVEILDRESGPSEATRSIRRQVEKLTDLTRRLGRLAILENKEAANFDLSDLLYVRLDEAAPRFAEKKIDLQRIITGPVPFRGDEEAMGSLVDELVENALKFARSRAVFSMKTEGERVVLTLENDTDLPDGPADAAFDRFTRLANAGDAPGSGLGLAYVKDAVRAHNGRYSARVDKGAFILRLDF